MTNFEKYKKKRTDLSLNAARYDIYSVGQQKPASDARPKKDSSKGGITLTDTKQLESVLEQKHDIINLSSLIGALYEIVDGEAQKENASEDVILGAADMLAYLGGDTEAENEAGVDRIWETVKKHVYSKKAEKASRSRSVKWKLIVPITAALIILASFAAVTFAVGGRISDWTNRIWKSVEPGEKIVDGDYEAEKSKDHRDYDEFEALLAEEGIEGVLVPNGMEITEPLVIEYGAYRKITATLTDGDGNRLEYQVQYPSQAEKINAELTKIGAFEVSLTSYDGSYQAEFISDGVWYLIKTDDRDVLTELIESLGK